VSDPASISFAALAEEYRRAGRHDDAIATCLTGLARHPLYVSARVTLGRALMETGKYDDARVQFEHVVRLAPENLAAIRALAALHERLSDQAPAAEPSSTAAGAADSAAVAREEVKTSEENSALPKLQSFLAAIEHTRRNQEDPRAPGR
jgi:tetratricopeptide (TPR) repeat protein